MGHESWGVNKQMTAYHVPIRKKMQQAIVQLVRVYHGSSAIRNDDFGLGRANMKEQIKTAEKQFAMAMMVLSGHVVKEEGGTFPALAHFFPRVDMNDLYDTHRE